MHFDWKAIPSFGVAGNFTGHLEQAGEAGDFAHVKTAEASAPKALFPTYIPPLPEGQSAVPGESAAVPGTAGASRVPPFLHVFPFDSDFIIFPKGEEKLQIEPECAVVFEADWQEGKLVSLTPLCFGASNDCSIRKAGAKKISEKKNWGACSKGFSSRYIPLTGFQAGCELDGYRIASFLVRKGNVYAYGEDSPVAGYSYIWEKLTDWLVEKLNFQQDEGPAEDVHSYLLEAACPRRIFVSIGATRYTDYGEHHFLQDGDAAVVVLYPGSRYTAEQILRKVAANDLNGPDNTDISALWQTVRV